jgi:hypothetical protein
MSSIKAISMTENPKAPKTSLMLPSILLFATSMFDLVFIVIKILFFTPHLNSCQNDNPFIEKMFNPGYSFIWRAKIISFSEKIIL